MEQSKANAKIRTPHRRGRPFDSRQLVALIRLPMAAALVLITAYQLFMPARIAAQIDIKISEPKIGSALKDPAIPWQLESDEIFYDQNYEAFVAKGNCSMATAMAKTIAIPVCLLFIAAMSPVGCSKGSARCSRPMLPPVVVGSPDPTTSLTGGSRPRTVGDLRSTLRSGQETTPQLGLGGFRYFTSSPTFSDLR